MTKYVKTCSFFGHSQIVIDDELVNKIKDKVIELVEVEGVAQFYFGGFGNFDELCNQIVAELQNTYPHIKRFYCVHNEDWILRPHKRPKYLRTEDYDNYIYLPLQFEYWYTRIYYRNCAMIDASDVVVFYVNHSGNSGAYKALQYATKNKKPLCNFGIL